MGIFGSIVAVGAVGELMRRETAQRVMRRYASLLDPRVGFASGALLALVLGITAVNEVASTEATVTVDTSLYPIAATQWIDQEQLAGNIALPLPYGGYAIWNFVPDLKVAVDGRNVTLYDSGWIDDYLLALDEGRALEVLDEAEVDVWLLRVDEEGEQIAVLEATGRWSVAYRDEVAAVVLPGNRAVVVGDQPAGPAEFPASVRP